MFVAVTVAVFVRVAVFVAVGVKVAAARMLNEIFAQIVESALVTVVAPHAPACVFTPVHTPRMPLLPTVSRLSIRSVMLARFALASLEKLVALVALATAPEVAATTSDALSDAVAPEIDTLVVLLVCVLVAQTSNGELLLYVPVVMPTMRQIW